MRFDFGNAWSTSVWLEKGRSAAGDAALWRAAPANPAACVVVPVDAAILKKVLSEAEKKPELPAIPNLANLSNDRGALIWLDLTATIAPVRKALGIKE